MKSSLEILYGQPLKSTIFCKIVTKLSAESHKIFLMKSLAKPSYQIFSKSCFWLWNQHMALKFCKFSVFLKLCLNGTRLSITYYRLPSIWAFDIQASIYLSKLNNRSTRKRCEICSKLTTIKTPERTYFKRSSGASIVDFKNVSCVYVSWVLRATTKDQQS